MNTQLPLSGIRVIDLTTVVMGPFATRILADLGADVIKVEGPEGDSLRRYEPQRGETMSGSFLNLNRNKRGICLDLKSADGKNALAALIGTADVLVHNLRPAVIARLGFDYNAVRKINPDIIYCAARGFGSAGPYAEKPAYDDIIQAGSGLAMLHADRDGIPAYVPSVVCDKLAGQAVAYAIMAGLIGRMRGGGGQSIEVPMFETAIDFNLVEHMSGFGFMPALSRPGFARVLSRQRKPFRTQDGHICILPYSDRNWEDVYRFTQRAEFCDDPRFRTLSERVKNIDHLYRMLDEEAATRATAEWVRFCDEASIPCMPLFDIVDLPDDPHVQCVGLFETHEHPAEGRYQIVRQPVMFDDAPFALRYHAPQLGEHTTEILREIGLLDDLSHQADHSANKPQDSKKA